MKLVVLYRPQSEYSRVVEEFVARFKRQYPEKKVEVIDVDSAQGINLAGLYDITSYPAILAMTEDGSMLNGWMGPTLPLMDEVVSYVR
ncbi:MAG TPA: hypothetical protein VMR18_03125 [Candidatus Saccharimonadales bacterium]|nr:hypothetical protein [Candidatus Saccharimonadales bacterium]